MDESRGGGGLLARKIGGFLPDFFPLVLLRLKSAFWQLSGKKSRKNPEIFFDEGR
jgi:hypothetical protein